jgi:hypothetical protein
MAANTFARAAALAACLLLAPASALAYGGGGGGGGGDVGRSRGTGCGASIGSASTYRSYCNGVTDQASYQEEYARRQEAVDGAPTRDAREAARKRLDAEMALSGLAWNEAVGVAPKVRQLAMILESMVAAGDIGPEQAMGLVMIYNQGTQLRMRREARYTHDPANLHSLKGVAASPAPAAASPAGAPSAPAPTTTQARYANLINNHLSAVAAQKAYVKAHGMPASGNMPQDEEHASLLVSTLAWDETVDVPPAVRQMAVILEGQVMNGTITPRNAYTVLMVQLAKTGSRAAP